MPPSQPIDDELRRYVLINVPSVSYLEAALLFRRQAELRTVEDAARALYVSQRETSEILAALCECGVLARDGDGYRYAPKDDQMRGLLDRLARAYASDLVAITNLIHDKTHRNARRFADAFRLRKDD